MTNIYSKLSKVQVELQSLNLRKTGKNTYSGFQYFELSDFLPSINNLCLKYGLSTFVSFEDGYGILSIADTESDKIIQVKSPLCEIELKGCNAAQAIGAVQTYTRRYLYLAAFNIVEADSFDATMGKPETNIQNNQQKQYENKQQSNVQQKKLVKDLQYGYELAVNDEVPFKYEDGEVFYKLCYNKNKNMYFYVISQEDGIHPKFINSKFE